MAKSYVKFETAKEVVDKAYEALRTARQTGSVKKGSNESTKSIERGLAKLVIIAEDVSPEEVVMHIPMLCEQKKIPFLYVPTKLDLGKALGINVPCTAAAIENAGNAGQLVNDIISRLTGKASPKQQEQKQEKPAEKAAGEKHAEKQSQKEKGGSGESEAKA